MIKGNFGQPKGIQCLTSPIFSKTGEVGELRARLEAAELRFADAQDQIGDLRRRLDQADAERRQAQQQLAAILTDQRAAPPASPRRARWLWRRG